MAADPKSLRIVDDEYLDFIRDHCYCFHCGQPVRPNHTKTVGSGGSDLLAVGLCQEIHQFQHANSLPAAEQKYGFSYKDLIIDTLHRFRCYQLGLGTEMQAVHHKSLRT